MRAIILASESPRRQELIRQMGIPFTVLRSDYNEQLDDTRDVHEVAKELGLGKANAVASRHTKALVIGSDTIVAFQGKQLGKQPDAATAKALLMELSGQAIDIITSVALVCQATGLEKVQAETARIVFKPYDEAAVDAYIDSGDWQGVAAAIAIQSPHSPPVAYIEGNYDTILGLATVPLATILQKEGIPATAATPPCPWPLRALQKSA